jgi:hypothetical protein
MTEDDALPKEKTLVSEADLDEADSADAPAIAEALADRLEAQLEAIERKSEGGGG